MSDWIRHAVWWQVYPLGALGAEPSALPPDAAPVPRLRRLIGWIPHLVSLGCNGLALGPVFESQTHGYDTVDHFRVDRRLGTDQDLQDLIDACSAAGVRVLLDGVFNHVGRDFPQFRRVLAEGPGSPAAAWFSLDPSVPGPDGFGYRSFEGHSALVAVDHGNPEVAEHVTAVMNHWCERGVAAWRLDAGYAVPPAFWRRVLPQVRDRHPDVWVVAEVIHGDYAGYVAESGVDSVTQYELWKAIWSSLNDRNLFELAHALRRHREMVTPSGKTGFLPQTFVGNHDVTRLASRLTDGRHLAPALALLFALPGVPTVYYGDEFGWQGTKEEREGGDDAVRPLLPHDPLAAGQAAGRVVDLHRQLIGVRRRHPWLASAVIEEPDVLRNEVLGFRLTPAPGASQRGTSEERTGARSQADGHRLTSGGEALGIALNVGDAEAEVALALPGGELLAGTGTVRGREGGVSVRVPPHAVVLIGRQG